MLKRFAIMAKMDNPLLSYADSLKGKSILITGGTGSFGSAAVDALLPLKPKRIVIFSRDEQKQFDMRNRIPSELLEFHIGDVRDRERVDHVMEGIDFVFHAAALKQVPTGEFFPQELVKTNVLGSQNVFHSAIDHGVERVVALSTDKACTPINVLGMTKALMERLITAAARRTNNKTILCGTRYGNVLFTRGSVIPLFIEQIKNGKPLTITNGDMTRCMITLQESLDLVLYALTEGASGDLYVRKAPAATIRDLAEAVVEMFDHAPGIKEIGIRPGEKAHESLISQEERPRTRDCGNYYCIKPETMDIDVRKYYFEGDTNGLPDEGYTSENTERLSKEQIKKLLLSVPEFKEEYDSFHS